MTRCPGDPDKNDKSTRRTRMLFIVSDLPLIIEETHWDILAAGDLAEHAIQTDDPALHARALRIIARLLSATGARLEHVLPPVSQES